MGGNQKKEKVKKKNKNYKHFTQNTKCKTMLLFKGRPNNEAQDRNMNIKIKSEAEKVSENIEDSSGASKALMDTATMVGNKQLQKDKSSQQRNRQSW